MTEPFIAPKKPQEQVPSVVDLRDGWKFGYQGVLIKTALMEKVDRIERQVTDLMDQLSREIGDDPKTIVGLFVAVQSPDPNAKARYVRDLAQRVVDLQEERDRLARAAKGFNANMIYVISEQDLKEMGL